VTTLEASVRFSGLPWEHVGWGSLNFNGGYAIFSTYNTTTSLFARSSTNGTTEQQTNLGPIPAGFHTYRVTRETASASTDAIKYYIDGTLVAQHTVNTVGAMYVYQSHNGGTTQTLDIDRIWIYPGYVGTGSYQSCTMDIGHTQSSWTTATWNAAVPTGTTLQLRTRTSTDGTTWSGWSAALTVSGQDVTSPAGRYLQYLAELTTSDPNQSAVLDSVTMQYGDSSVPQNHSPVAVNDSASTSEGGAVTIPVLSNDSDQDGDPLTITSATQGNKGVVTVNAGQTITYTTNPGACGTDAFNYAISDGRGGTASASVSLNIACVSGQLTQTTVADFGAVCAVPTNTIVSLTGNGEVRLAGTQGDEYLQTTLDPTRWVAGTWNGGAYAPSPTAGVLSVADPNGAYVRSATSMAATTVESSARFTAAPWEHIGWASLDFGGGYAIFSTYNTSTNLFARTNAGSGEQQTNLGPIPSGFHTFRIDRQVASPSTDALNYYIDGILVAQHSVSTLASMYVYQSNNGGGVQTLDVDRIWVYPGYVSDGTFQSCTLDGGGGSFSWTTATWNAATPAGTSLQLLTRTSVDGSTWSPWSAPLTTSGQSITSPAGRYLQYQLALQSTDPGQSPVVDSVTIRVQLGDVDATPPIISSVGASAVTAGSAVVSWLTDEPATSQVQYGTSPGYGSSTILDSALVTSHTQTLTGLTAATLYNYRVISRDGSGNEADSPNFTFITSAPALTINDVSVTESNSGTVNATFTVSLSAPSSQTVTVSYATANGTAVSPGDYAATSATLTFAPGITSLPVTVVVNGDSLSESNETFLVILSGATNATLARAQGVGTIANDDPLPSLGINDVSTAEGNSGTKNGTLTVSLSTASGQDVTVGYATANGTATAGSDYAATSGTLTIPAGTTSRSINVVINGDLAAEPNETFFMNLSGAVNATIADGQGIGTILNDDAPSMSINDVSITEGNSGSANAIFAITLNNPTTQTVTVLYATANGTASSSSDYSARSGTLTFPPGTTSLTVAVPVLGDTLSEINETFVVNLSGATNATVADAQGVATIVNDDALPTLSINDVSITEGNSGTTNATFTVSLSSASGQTITVNYATGNGTATAGSDYTTTSGTLTFTAGTTTRTFSVATLGDTVPEADETFVVNLSAPANATLARAQGTGTIRDTDGTITVTSPNNGVTWAIGSVHAMTWTNNLGTAATVKLELSRDRGATWQLLAASVENLSASGGSYNWTVTGPATTGGRVRATWNTNPGVTDTSSGNFRIQ
jgi:hypothetical protein